MAEKKFLDDNGVLYLWSKIKSLFVAKETGKGLSTNDYTTAEKNKLSTVAEGATNTTVENVLTSDSTTNALSAAKGKELDERITAINDNMADLGAGDMLRTTYDTDMDGVIDNAAKLGGNAPDYYAAAKDIPDISGKADKATTLAGYGITNAYTTEQTDNAIAVAVANAGHLAREIVAELPAVEEANDHTIYMVPDAEGEDDNTYIEYMLINGKFERTGSSDVDLSGYMQKTDITAITNAEIDTIVST